MTELVTALAELGVWVRLHYVYPYPHVDEVIPLMAEGKVLAEGTVDEVKNDERVIEAYLGRGLKNKIKEEAAHG